MSSNERIGHFANIGRKSHRGDQKRCTTPIPVAPPRVPTPMPAAREVQKLSQHTRTIPDVSTSLLRNFEEKALPWINPRFIAKVNNDNRSEIIWPSVNDLHHTKQLTETRINVSDRQKVEQSKLLQARKRSHRIKLCQNETKFQVKNKVKEETSNRTSEKISNLCTGEEEDVAVSLTCASVESGCATSQVSLSSDVLATNLNNNSVRNNNNRYCYKYYGFLDSGDETPSPVETGKFSGTGGSWNDKLAIKMGTVHNNTRSRKSTITGKEIVYENPKIESSKAGKNMTSKSDEERTILKIRKDENKPNYEHLSRRYLECNVRVGKYEKKLSSVLRPQASFSDLYGAQLPNVTSFEDCKGGLYDGFRYLESKYTYAVSGIPENLAQSSAAAAFFARASQKLNLSSPHRRKRYASSDDDLSKTTGFSSAIHRTPPPMPPALLRRIGVKEVTGVGKVKVMLKVAGVSSAMRSGGPSFFNVDSRKKQVTLYDPAQCTTPAAPEDRRVGVAAPKMFAFDAIFTQDDSQAEICSTALTDVIHAVINGTDGCLFCFGHAKLGKTTTMLGTAESANTLGIIPSAISWLFRGIHEQKQKTGARFSVRVSAVEVCQPTQQLKDLLSGHANDCEQSPGVYLRDDPLFGTQLQNQSELRVPNAEKAAFYLDAAVNSRSCKEEGRDSHFLYTLHVYQYSVAGKGGVAGGRSRLHLIDLGSCERGKSGGGIPLSGLGNVLLAIFNGQKHLPYREHKITQLLKECLSSLTCHAAMIAHVSQCSQHYTDTLTTVQLASRIHRMRRRKMKFGGPVAGNRLFSNGGSSDEISRQNASTGSSDFDLSSSEQSADTVIYVAAHDDTATDGEHPPVYLLSMNSVDNQCALNKATKGPRTEPRPGSKSKDASPIKSATSHKTKEEKAAGSSSLSNKNNKSGISSSKSSPIRTTTNKIPIKPSLEHHGNAISTNAVPVPGQEEHWIDGPRVSKHKVAEFRSLLLKESIKKETWIDGPMQKPSKTTGTGQSNGNYGFMDNHKKTMIRKWVENQTVHLKQTLTTPVRSEITSGLIRSSEPVNDSDRLMCNSIVNYEKLGECKDEGSGEVIKPKTVTEDFTSNVTVGTALIKQTDVCLQQLKKAEDNAERIDCGKCSECSEEKLHLPPLPLVLRYGKDLNISNQTRSVNTLGIQNRMMDDYNEEEDEIELEIVEITDSDEQVPMQDSCLQVTEEDIAFCLGKEENPLPEVDQESHEEHPLRILSQENLTVVSTFTDSLSVSTDFERCLPRPRYAPPSLFDQPFYPNGPYVYDEYIEHLTNSQKSDAETLNRLTELHKLYKSKIRISGNDPSKISAKRQSCSLTDVCKNMSINHKEIPSGNCSIYSEPAYKLLENVNPVCNSCKKTFPRVDKNEKGLRHRDFIETFPSTCKMNMSSLRHPDGASNPSLDQDEKKERTSGNGTSKSDYEEENLEKTTSKNSVINSEQNGSNGSPIRKFTSKANNSKHEGLVPKEKLNESTTKTLDVLKLKENSLKLSNSPTRNTNSLSRGELRRINCSNTNKGRRIGENEEITKCATSPPSTSSSSPLTLTQKHLYFNKTCPSNEGSDSGHESNISPKITKLNGRTRTQAQCESSGYESVVSFTSSLESEVGVKLVREESDEMPEPGGQSGWWCWCVSSRSATAQNSLKQTQGLASSERPPLTLPPTSARPKT